ncbi:unnamed protein product [Phytomonas sp. EM1]|nr:unnamed protein product [Phytomonas sp. EM1]|eukprot:CCW61907.1 unnamed protein product [Phytomonas sp. isolate EM1]
MQLRRATMEDVYEMQQCNLICLPENYNLRYYYYHILSWPQLLYVQQDYNRNTVGYVLGKIDDEEDSNKKHGHITSLAVLRSHRKLGIASRVMRATMKEMDEVYETSFCSLHVRKSNDAALHLYQDTLHFRCAGVEEKYYLDNEDAYHMKYFFNQKNPGTYVDENKRMIHKPFPGVENKKENRDSNSGGGADRHPGKGPKANSQKNSKNLVEEKTMEMTKLLEELDEDGKSGGKKRGNDGKGAKSSSKHSSHQHTATGGNKKNKK